MRPNKWMTVLPSALEYIASLASTCITLQCIRRRVYPGTRRTSPRRFIHVASIDKRDCLLTFKQCLHIRIVIPVKVIRFHAVRFFIVGVRRRITILDLCRDMRGLGALAGGNLPTSIDEDESTTFSDEEVPGKAVWI